jgi:hypothetical protein
MILGTAFDEQRTISGRGDTMGLKKRVDFDHTQESVFEAAGYSEETVTEELEPRAMLLANQLVHAALTDPMTAIEVLLDSPVMKDDELDSRDRAIIVMMTGRFLGRAAIGQLNASYGSVDGGAPGNPFERRSPHGHSGTPLKIGRVEWDTLVHHVEHKVFGSLPRKESEHVEKIQEVLDDDTLSTVQKAVVEVLVLRNWATETEGQWGASLPDTMSN